MIRTIKTEDYLKNIYSIAESEKVTLAGLARSLGNKPPTVLEMVRKMQTLGLLTQDRHEGIRLTDAGRTYALQIIRRHRLWETFLFKVLHLEIGELHTEAEKLEHVYSERLEQKIAELLHDPMFDPHGHPIPSNDGSLPPTQRTSGLLDLGAGQSGTIVRINDYDREVLEQLVKIKLLPGTKIWVKFYDPQDGTISIRVGKKVHRLDSRIARAVFVEIRD